ncbi:AraC family transcriptional regulator [Treponema primitia]|uniref:helix-turn-helix domain-containing protein n=1 Tax=Treponema primitia TaxID=88058 RepID=UPI00397ED7B4
MDILWPQPEYLQISYFKEKTPYLSGHIGHNETYHQSCPPGFRRHCFGLSILPGFYEDILYSRYHISPGLLSEAILELGKGSMPIEGAMILKQMSVALPSSEYVVPFYEAKTLELIVSILKWYTKKDCYASKGFSPKDEERINETIWFIKDHYSKLLELSALAKIASMSISKFTSVFKVITGVTVLEYIQNIRLEKAKELLTEPSPCIKSIASVVDYKHQASFSAIFKKEIGVSPTEYLREFSRIK